MQMQPQTVQSVPQSQAHQMPQAAQPHANPKPETAAPKAQTHTELHSGMHHEENDRLWHRVFEEGEDEAGSFNLIRSGTMLYHVGEKNFTVVANNDFTKKYTEQMRDLIEKIMTDKLGHPVQMVCCLESEIAKQTQMLEEKAEEPKEDDQKLAEEASRILGVDIEID